MQRVCHNIGIRAQRPSEMDAYRFTKILENLAYHRWLDEYSGIFAEEEEKKLYGAQNELDGGLGP